MIFLSPDLLNIRYKVSVKITLALLSVFTCMIFFTCILALFFGNYINVIFFLSLILGYFSCALFLGLLGPIIAGFFSNGWLSGMFLGIGSSLLLLGFPQVSLRFLDGILYSFNYSSLVIPIIGGALIGALFIRFVIVSKTGRKVKVVSWSALGATPDLCNNRWVMLGGANFRNFLFSGVYSQILGKFIKSSDIKVFISEMVLLYKNYKSSDIDLNNLIWPCDRNYIEDSIKGMMDQRRINLRNS